MANVVDELLISIGVDSKELMSGINQAQTDIKGFANDAARSFSGISKAGKGAGEVSALSFSNLSGKMQDVGATAKEAAASIAGSFRGLEPVFKALTSRITQVAATFGLMLGTAQTLSNFIEKSDALGKLSRQLGINERELDAWGKANEAAGGSAEALFSSLKAYYDKTGRPAEEFFHLGEKIEGMTRRQTQAYLRAQGVAWDAIPIFLKGQKAADDLVAKYRKTAFTAQDAKTARAFKVAWMDFKIAAQNVGNTLVRLVAPAVTNILNGLSKLVGFIEENARALGLMAVGFGLVFGIKSIERIKAAIIAIRAFGLALKVAVLPLTAIIAGVVALALAIDDLIGFTEGADSLFGRMLKNLGMSNEEIESIRQSFKEFGAAIGWLWDTLKPVLSGFLAMQFKIIAAAVVFLVTVIENVVVLFVRLFRVIGKGWDYVKGLFGDLSAWFGDLKDKASELASDIGDKFGAAWDWTKGVGSKIGDALADADGSAKSWAASIPDIFSRAFAHGFLKASEWVRKLPSVFGSISQWLADAFTGIPDAILDALNIAWDYVKNWFKNLGGMIREALSGSIGGFLKKIGQKIGIVAEDSEETGDVAKQSGAFVTDVQARQAALQPAGANVSTQATMNVVNNITTKDNPAAISRAVTGSVKPAWKQTYSMIGNSMSAVNQK